MDKKKRLLVTMGIAFLIFGLYLISYNYFKEKIDKAYDEMNLQLISFNNNWVEVESDEMINISNLSDEFTYVEIETNTSSNLNNNKTSDKTKDKYETYYTARLKIPKINLDRGLVDINSKYNIVNKNIQIIKGSSYPNVAAGNFILAAHNGTSSVSYFKNLYKLSKGDKCQIIYQGKTYTYNIVDIYYQKKDGDIVVYRDYSKTTLTLVTCTKNSKDKQTIYIAELIGVK